MRVSVPEPLEGSRGWPKQTVNSVCLHVAVIGPEKSTSLAIFRLKNNHYSILSCNSDVAWDEGDVLPAAVEKVAKRAFRAGWPRPLL